MLSIGTVNGDTRYTGDSNYSDILSFWGTSKNRFHINKQYDEVVLFVGNAGSGKSTLLSGLINENLFPVWDDGCVIVDTKGRIGTGSESRTLVPEIISDTNTNITFVDLPGFRDTRDIEYEISAAYFQKALVNHLNKVKIIITINFDSVKPSGGNLNDFDNLVDGILEFIPNITKLLDGTMMVVTKADKLSKGPRQILNGVEKFLLQKKTAYSKKSGVKEKKQKMIQFIENLLEKRNNVLKRITVFQKPDCTKPVRDSIKDDMSDALKMLVENLQYVTVNEHDFNSTINEGLQNSLKHMISDIFHGSLLKLYQNVVLEIRTHYLQLEKEYNDIRVIRNRLFDAVNSFSMIDKSSLLGFFQKLFDAISKLNVRVSKSNLQSIASDTRKIVFFITISSHRMTTEIDSLKNGMRGLIHFIERALNWNIFLVQLEDKLCNYGNQENFMFDRVTAMTNSFDYLEQLYVRDIRGLRNLTKDINCELYYNNTDSLQINHSQFRKLWTILDNFCRKPKYTPCSSPHMMVHGYNIKMSDVIENECWMNAKDIRIFALNKIFIDSSFTKESAKLSIFAYTWEVFGVQQFVLSGKNGALHTEQIALGFCGKNGKAGLPGQPGGAGGRFIGVGHLIENGNNLRIQANGGNGGRGQNGATGRDGIMGDEFKEEYTAIRREADEAMPNFLNGLNLKFEKKDKSPEICGRLECHIGWVFHIHGKEATPPGDGGIVFINSQFHEFDFVDRSHLEFSF